MAKKSTILFLFSLLFIGYLFSQENDNGALGKVLIDESGNISMLENYSTSNPTQNTLGSSVVQRSTKDLPADQELNQEPILQEFIDNQKKPLTDSNEEAFLLFGKIWQRLYGEKEYFLAPEINDIKKYYQRIKQKDDKENNILKSKYHFIYINLTNYSKNELLKLGIEVPDFIKDKVLVRLPEIDINNLSTKGIPVQFNNSYGDKGYTDLGEPKNTDATLWSDDFDSFPGSFYSVGDDNGTNGYDYWDDDDCDYYSSSPNRSIWCADIGGEPKCTNYDDYMDAYVYPTNGHNVDGYTNVKHYFARKYETEENYDYMRRLYSSNGSTWTEATSYTGSADWGYFSASLSGTWTTYYWQFRFQSDNSVNNYYGACLDYMKLTGDGGGDPNLTRVSGQSSLNVSGTTVSVSLTVINDGSADAGSSYVGYYLSENTSFNSSDDYLFGTDYVSSLSPGATSPESITQDVSTISPTIPPGVYYVFYFIDHNNDVIESNESDNIFYWPTTQVTIPNPEPNLTRVSGSSSLNVSGTVVSVSIVVINDGDGSAGSSYVGYYLSENSSFSSSDDYLFGTDYVSSLNPGATSPESITQDVTSVTPTIPPGIYYVIYYIDHNDDVAETDESDNIFYWSGSQVTIYEDPPAPNIITTNYNSTINYGGYFDLEVQSINQGGPSDEGSITISFPDLNMSNAASYVQTLSGTSSDFTVYPYNPGSTINHKNGYQITATDLVVEAVDNSWGTGETNTLQLRITPQNTGTFTVRIRSTMHRIGDLNEWYSDPTSGPLDQQGWWVNEEIITVNVQDPDLVGYEILPNSPILYPTESFTARYQINSANTQNVSGYLCFRSRTPAGFYQFLEDENGDIYTPITITPGTNWYERECFVYDGAVPGVYRVTFFITPSEVWGDYWDSQIVNDAFEVITPTINSITIYPNDWTITAGNSINIQGQVTDQFGNPASNIPIGVEDPILMMSIQDAVNTNYNGEFSYNVQTTFLTDEANYAFVFYPNPDNPCIVNLSVTKNQSSYFNLQNYEINMGSIGNNLGSAENLYSRKTNSIFTPNLSAQERANEMLDFIIDQQQAKLNYIVDVAVNLGTNPAFWVGAVGTALCFVPSGVTQATCLPSMTLLVGTVSSTVIEETSYVIIEELPIPQSEKDNLNDAVNNYMFVSSFTNIDLSGNIVESAFELGDVGYSTYSFVKNQNDEYEHIFLSGTDNSGMTQGINIWFDIDEPNVPIYNTIEQSWFNSNTVFDIDFSDNINLNNIYYQIDSNDDSDPSNWHPLTSDGVSILAESQNCPGTTMTTNWMISNSDWNALPLNVGTLGIYHLYFKVTDDLGNSYITPNEQETFEFRKDIYPPSVSVNYPTPNLIHNNSEITTLWNANDIILGLSLSGVDKIYFKLNTEADYHEVSANVNSHTYSGLADGIYTFYIYATDNANNQSAEIEVDFEINTAINPPTPFGLLEPDPGDQTSITPLLEWETSIDPDGTQVFYSLYLADNPGFNGADVTNNISTNSYQIPVVDALDYNSDYYWKVKAVDGNGHEKWSNELDWWFTTESDPAPPHLTLTPDFQNFGEILADECSEPITFTLLNDGGALAEGIIPYGVEPPDNYIVFDIVNVSTGDYNFSLNPNESLTFDIIFCPFEPCFPDQTLVIDANDPCNDPTAQLVGVGYINVPVILYTEPAGAGETYGEGSFMQNTETCISTVPEPGFLFDYWEEICAIFGSYSNVSETDFCFNVGYEPNICWIAHFNEISFNIKVTLEGPFNSSSGLMQPTTSELIPLSQPFDKSPWNYFGSENMPYLINPNIVDWILVEYRDAPGDAVTATNETRIGRQAALLLSDGSVVDVDGISPLKPPITISDNLYIVIWHRNHLGVMSASPLLHVDGTFTFDFSASSAMAFGGVSSQTEIAPGWWAMISGDANADGIIDINDKTYNWNFQVSENGYLASDLNLDGQVNNIDKNDYWWFNLNLSSNVPSGGFACGDLFVDVRDGHSYETVLIDNQCWMAENLNYESIYWDDCYEGLATNCGIYGKLYNIGSADIACPEGWHLPNQGEWQLLFNNLGGNSIAGGKLKTTGTIQGGNGLWIEPNFGATNESGFSAIPGGFYYGYSTSGYNFFDKDTVAYYWTSSVKIEPYYYMTWMGYFNEKTYFGTFEEVDGASIRCIKDGLSANLPPIIPDGQSPWTNTSNISINTELGWDCIDPEGDPLTYDVYLDTNNPPTTVLATGLTVNTFDPGGLNYGSTYYWRIVAHDNDNATPGYVWWFTTEQSPTWQCEDALIDTRDSQIYETVEIGTQCWMAENLNFGNPIPNTQDQQNNSTVEKYCYNDEVDSCDVYGGIYQWDELMNYISSEGGQGICPDGWHVPTDVEWCTLENFEDSQTIDCNSENWRGLDGGGNLKATGLRYWDSPNLGAANEHGFNAKGGGYYNYSFNPPSIDGLGQFGQFWTSSRNSATSEPWMRGLHYNKIQVRRVSQSQDYGLSLRCIKD